MISKALRADAQAITSLVGYSDQWHYGKTITDEVIRAEQVRCHSSNIGLAWCIAMDDVTGVTIGCEQDLAHMRLELERVYEIQGLGYDTRVWQHASTRDAQARFREIDRRIPAGHWSDKRTDLARSRLNLRLIRAAVADAGMWAERFVNTCSKTFRREDWTDTEW